MTQGKSAWAGMAMAIAAGLMLTGCGSESDKTAETLLKGNSRYSPRVDQLEAQAKNDLGMTAKQLVSRCIDAALAEAHVPADQMSDVRAKLINPDSGNSATRQLSEGVANQMDRCIVYPAAYNIGK